MNKKIMIPIMVLVLVLMVPLVQYTTAPKPQAIPFVGMSLVYYANVNGETQIRTVCVLKYNSTTNCVTIRDANAVMEVDVGTREVKWCSEPWLTGSYVEYWIPTSIEIGSHVNTLIYDAVVIDSTEMSVDGKTVSAWQLHASGTREDGTLWQDTWYYEKKTGLCVGAAWIMYDSSGQVLNNWGGHLVSTNVALP
jgi:hypothetical protein